MKALRWVVAALAVIVSLAAIARLVVPRVQCNREKARLRVEARAFRDMGDEYARTMRARRNVEVCRRCVALVPDDYLMWFLLGINEGVLQRPDDALRSFRQSLALNERPETYAEIALVELRRGNVETARELLIRASMFNMTFSEYVEHPMRSDIYIEAQRRQRELLARRTAQQNR